MSQKTQYHTILASRTTYIENKSNFGNSSFYHAISWTVTRDETQLGKNKSTQNPKTKADPSYEKCAKNGFEIQLQTTGVDYVVKARRYWG